MTVVFRKSDNKVKRLILYGVEASIVTPARVAISVHFINTNYYYLLIFYYVILLYCVREAYKGSR